MPPAILAITWFSHRRTENICARFGWKYVVLETSSRGLLRYLRLAPRTIMAVARSRPAILIVQNPSLVLAFLTVLIRPVFAFKLVVDAHNEAVQPYLTTSKALRWLARQCLRRADITIVTNTALANEVVRAGGRPFVLPDPLPKPPDTHVDGQRRAKLEVVVISTFAPDEPLEEIFEAARQMTEVARFRVTGNLARLPDDLSDQAPPNVVFTGFLPEPAYWALLRGSDVVMDLTKMPDCLVCGAYEAIAVMKPVVLTDSEPARAWFGDAATYVRNDARHIARALNRLATNSTTDWESRAVRAIARIESEWEERRTDFVHRLTGLLRTTG
jgi:glycosyltransferase involved in cell wall biosynthesis